MSESRKDKDSYAKDTLQYTVPPEERRRSQQRIRNASNVRSVNMNDGRNNVNRPPQKRRPAVQRTDGASRPAAVSKQSGQNAPHPQRRSQGSNNPQRTAGSASVVHPHKPVKQKSKKVRKKGGCIVKIIISLLSLLLLVFIIYSIISIMLISKVEVVETGERGIPSHSLYSSVSVKNVLLIGTDSRGEDRGRSDSMILLSINSKTNTISLVSFMRDTYVQIPGYGEDRLNAAYSQGGPELLMDTIEENFYIEIDDYVTVNFISFANIVDSVGGVEIEVTEEEADAINVLLDSSEGHSFFGTPDESDYLDGAGKYMLNGKQALCYSRLRYVGNADFERTERQRIVLTEMIKKAVKMNPLKLSTTASDILPSMNTNMSRLDMYLMSLRLPTFVLGYDIEQLRIPADNTYSGIDVDGKSVLEVDIDANLDIIEDKLYNTK